MVMQSVLLLPSLAG
uniref:Uncharacterized protein n=1 Tax=Anguilla anguilla TaxID=7936 RepID=A0A0E9V8A5_ANGAN